MESRREDDGNAAKVVVTFATIVSEDVISIDDFVEDISFEPCFLDEMNIKVFVFHHGNEMFIACVVVWLIG